MQTSQKIAIAAHLHVLLRRKTGRVTDTEWMAKDSAYAAEIIRFARASAKENGHTDLAEWADKLEAAVFGTQPARQPTPAAQTVKPPVAENPVEPPDIRGTALRYVRGIR
jgi:hypothetical protein